VHKQGSTNPADVPSREPHSCMADSTGARLDTALVDWPLPTVLQADMQPDVTAYSHDSLALQLGMTPASNRPAGAAAVACMAEVQHLQGLPEELMPSEGSPAAALLQAPVAAPGLSQLAHESLQCAMTSNGTSLDDILPSTSALLGGGSVWAL